MIDTSVDSDKTIRATIQMLFAYLGHEEDSVAEERESPLRDTKPATQVTIPAPMPVPSAPMIPPPPGPAAAPEYDSAGIAHDPNIHSSKKTKTIDGRWRPRRGSQVPAVTTPTSEAGVSFKPAAYTPPSLPAIPPPPSVAPVPTAEDDVDLEPDDTSAAPAMTFETFITRVTAAMSEGKLDQPKIVKVMKDFDFDSVWTLNTKPEMLPQVAAALGVA